MPFKNVELRVKPDLVTAASCRPSACCWPEAEEPDDCSAALQADDHFAAALPGDCLAPVDSSVDDCSERAGSAPDDCWVAVPVDHSAPEAQIRGSAADLAQAGYSAPADSLLGDCSEQVGSARDDCWAAPASGDHSALAAGIRDWAQGYLLPDGCSGQADWAAAVMVAHSLASLQAGFQADSQRVAASQGV